MGRFVLQETPVPKVFIGTGTGFAPLYFMMRQLQTANFKLPTFFLFGVRELRDVFYTEALQTWSQLS
jgi:NAD(P)H-flavin reductase